MDEIENDPVLLFAAGVHAQDANLDELIQKVNAIAGLPDSQLGGIATTRPDLVRESYRELSHVIQILRRQLREGAEGQMRMGDKLAVARARPTEEEVQRKLEDAFAAGFATSTDTGFDGTCYIGHNPRHAEHQVSFEDLMHRFVEWRSDPVAYMTGRDQG